jgi:cytochrome P450
MPVEARKLSWADTLRLQLRLTIPAFLLGIVVPNRPFLWLAVRLGAGRPTMRLLQALRAKYACDHLWSRFPVRRTLLVFAPDTIEAVLRSDANAPDPALKKRALSRFVPGALVISNRDEARERRPFNTAALELGRLHRDAESFAATAAGEANRLLDAGGGTVRWSDFVSLGERISQRLILGRTDADLTKRLRRMVRLANVLLRDVPSYSAFYETLDRYLAKNESARGCLLDSAKALMGGRGSADASLQVPSQVGFWLFVLKDAVELHVARTLALIAAHPEVQARVRDEIRAAGTLTAASIDGLRHLEACIAEQLRLWTPVPLLLRRAEEPFTLVDGIPIAEEHQILIHAGFHHRDPRVFGDFADSFRPDAASAPSYVFSAHDRGCAGRSLATFVLKAALAALLARSRFELIGPQVCPGRIPYLYDHFAIELTCISGA